jgi:transcriptional regulator with XRE-family HTH domain
MPTADKQGTTLGLVLRDRRRVLGLTQLELAKRIKVESAYISAIEADRRRPSLGLLGRIADVLGVRRERLFLLSHPEAKSLIKTAPDASSRSRRKDHAWKEFKANQALLTRYGVKPEELRCLSQVRRLGNVRRPYDFLHILNAIRQALED